MVGWCLCHINLCWIFKVKSYADRQTDRQTLKYIYIYIYNFIELLARKFS